MPTTSSTGRSITLSADETALWERTDSEGQAFRRAICEQAHRISETLRAIDGAGHPVEVYAHDGITLESVEAAS